MAEIIIPPHDSDPIVNISQDYIEHLTRKKDRAAKKLTTAGSNLAAATNAFSEATIWHNQAHSYWVQVVGTNKKYKGIEKNIASLKARAKVVTSNTDAVAEAIEILVCITRRMAHRTEELKYELAEIKKKLVGADPNNDYLKLLTDFETQLDEAIKANNAAIVKVLDVLAVSYRLHISILGLRRMTKIAETIKKKYLSLNDDVKPSQKPDEALIAIFAKNRGLSANLDALHAIFQNGNAYHISENPDSLCPPPPPPPPIRFPLNETDNEYYELTKSQHADARGKLEAAEDKLSDIQQEYNDDKVADDALKLSLEAAMAAKSSTK